MEIKKYVESSNNILYKVKVYRSENNIGEKFIGVVIYRPLGIFRLAWQEKPFHEVGDLQSFVEIVIDTYEYDKGIGRFFHPSIDKFKEWNGDCKR